MPFQTDAEKGMNASAAEDQRRNSLFRVAVLVFIFNLISAAVFIAFVNHPVYDDGYNFFDVQHYASKGVSLATLRAQRNAPGPAGFIWMAASVRLIGGNELRDARIGALFSWMLLGAGIFLGARFSCSPDIWYAALLVSLVFPHSVMAAGTLLTEGPALLFAVLGALAWTEFVSRDDSHAASLILGMLGCLFLGLAVTCRQYSLAFLPAAALTAALQLRSRTLDPVGKWSFVGRALGCLALSLVPVLLLLRAWGGIASPGIESGTSYNMMYKASAGVNPLRPVIAALRLAVYLVPFTFPLIAKAKRLRLPVLAIALLGGIAAGRWAESFLQPGPLNSLVGALGRAHLSREIVFGAIAVVAIYNAIAFSFALWEQRTSLLSSPPAAFSLLAIVFFVGEQLAVGGNIPFYDRYVLQVAPFIGALAFAVLPVFDKARFMAIIALSFLSQFMLWRLAVGA